jgi:hypothetical protein
MNLQVLSYLMFVQLSFYICRIYSWAREMIFNLVWKNHILAIHFFLRNYLDQITFFFSTFIHTIAWNEEGRSKIMLVLRTKKWWLGITCHERLKEEFEWISFQTSVCGAQNDKLWATFERSGKIRQQSMRGSFCPRRARLLLGGEEIRAAACIDHLH